MNATIRKNEGPARHGQPLSNATAAEGSSAVRLVVLIEALVAARDGLSRAVQVAALRGSPPAHLASSHAVLAVLDNQLARIVQRLERAPARPALAEVA